MKTSRFILLAAPLLVAAIACDEPLAVDNVNQPDVGRVFGRPADVEQLIGNTYVAIHQATLGGGNDALQPQMLVMSLESYSGLANFNMGPRSAWPRFSLDNSRGNPASTGIFRDWSGLSRAARTAANGVAAFKQPGFTLNSAPLDRRARAFGFFSIGVAVGNLALAYDSATIISPTDSLSDLVLASGRSTPYVAPLVAPDSAMRFALTMLDSAIALASTTSFPALPQPWLNTDGFSAPFSGTVPAADFISVIRSYKARFRAGVARTVAQRTAVNWTLVIADAMNGIPIDYNGKMDPSKGWAIAWTAQNYLFDTWHQMPTPIIGMADGSGGYNAWLATPIDARTPFLIVTPDNRFPQGSTRAQQITDTIPVPPAGGQYFRNRPVPNDRFGETWANSFYDYFRFLSFFRASRIGNYPIMTRAELDMLMAEGYIRTGQFALAAARIDITRLRNNLPSVAGVANNTTPVPGGAACVPKVPQPPAFTSAACGNLFEAMKWEKRMETAQAGYGMWFFDSRGWGDLPNGTPIHFPVPWQESDSRRIPFRTSIGGVGNTDAAPRSTYGW